MGWHEQNIRVYDESADLLAAYFRGIGPRTQDVERGLELANAESDARVIEIGCGDGRDAEVITDKVGWYEGVDPSRGLLAIARERLPHASFVEADALSYDYPDKLDVVFAFASLLHVNKDTLPEVFQKGADALRNGGIYYLSVKEQAEYASELKYDEFGVRMFHYYNSGLLKSLAGAAFTDVYESHQTIGSTRWLTLALQKN